MKMKRIISTLLSMAMVLGMIVAVPAAIKPLEVAAATNLALSATYRGADGIGTNGTGNYGDGTSWNSYHTGKLNDGTIANAKTSTTTNTVEMCVGEIASVVKGDVILYFKLSSASVVGSVEVYTNRRDNAYRGHPDSISVYVGNSESDVSSATLLGTVAEANSTTHSSDGYVKKYTVTGTAKSGTYVIIKMNTTATNSSTTAGDGVIGVTEVQILQGSVGTQDVSSGVTYKGATGTNANGTGNYGEANWTTYHAGKLNDGVIASTYSESTQGQNVEIYLDSFAVGKVYVYFKLPEYATVCEVNAYANIRSNSTNRGYPDPFNIYVSNSESVGTLLGTTSYTSYNAGVRKYTAKGSAAGNYVVFEMTIPTNVSVIALTEVQIITSVSADKLSPPTLTGSTGRATYTVPTITWNAVEGAEKYDVYLNGTKVVSDTTSRSYTPTGLTPFELYGRTGQRSCESVTVVAKGSGKSDSDASAAFEFLYVNKPTNSSGTPVTSADVILDAGHGGSDPGAMLDPREEADDTLRMTLAVGQLLEEAGFSVAYTRTTDVFDSIYVKAAKGEAGNFRAFVSFHRNSATSLAEGVEYYYQTGETISQPLANAFNTEFVADGIWKNRGVKTASYVVLTQTSFPAALIELGFINNPDENTKFDTYFNETAQASARSIIKYLGHTVGYTGYIDAPASAAVSGAATTVSASVGNYGSDAKFDIRGWMLHSYGVEKMEYSINGGAWTALSLSNRSGELGAYTNYPNKANSGYSSTISTEGWAAGNYTIKVRGTTVWDSTTKYTQTFDVATINLTVNDTAPAQYTVTFKDWDGTVLSTQTVTEGGSATAPSAPSRIGYTFTGWDKAFNNITGDTTVTAQYSINTFTVTFVVDGETVDTQTVNYGSAATAPNVGTKEGYTFSGWDKTFNNVTSNLTVSGSWNINTFTVTFVVDGETVDTQTVNYGGAATAPEVGTKEGYTFSGWDKAFNNITSNLTVSGSWNINTFTVTFVVDGETVDTQTVNYGGAATAPEVGTKEGYTFSGWDKTFNNVTSNLTVSGSWNINTFTVTFVVDGETVDTQTVNYGSAATAPNVGTKEGYTFSGWDKTFDNITSDTIVSASWSINSFIVTFVAGEHGSLEGETEVTVEYGTDIENLNYPLAIADAGYKFAAWDITSGTISKDITITASFEYDESQWFTVTYIIPENATATGALSFGPFVTGTAWADAGITAPTVTGIGNYVFAGWDIDAPAAITEDLTFTAILDLKGNITISIVCGTNGVILHKDNDETVVGNYTISVEAGTLASEIELPYTLADEGYVFDNWYVDGEVLDLNSVLDKNITITAVFKAAPVAITESTVVNENNYATITLTVSADSANFASRLYVFNQHSNGLTTISTNAVNATEISAGVYEVSVEIFSNGVNTVDVFFSSSAINFASPDWLIVALKADIKL
ncbi:MAG: InlB B-repeat-containing protein [Clostridia bacterium]|nr:InlB B-repeat-containing protein [Clostridia bacterium]